MGANLKLYSGANATIQPRASIYGPNMMDGTVRNTTAVGAGAGSGSTTVSQTYQFFQLPSACFVIRGVFSGSQKSGVSGNTTLNLGTAKGSSAFGTYTLTGSTRQTVTLNITNPVTLSASGGAFSATHPQFYPVIATIETNATTTRSLSLYVMAEYMLPGKFGLPSRKKAAS